MKSPLKKGLALVVLASGLILVLNMNVTVRQAIATTRHRIPRVLALNFPESDN